MVMMMVCIKARNVPDRAADWELLYSMTMGGGDPSSRTAGQPDSQPSASNPVRTWLFV